MNSNLSSNALQVLEARYLLRDSKNQLIETPDDLFIRVATSVAKAEKKWGGPSQVKHWRSRFLSALTELEFLPNSPTLMNAGTPLGQLSACFVLPVEDDLIKIFDALKLMAIVQQSGGGTGFSFSKLRMKGDPVSVTSGVASGPVSFMKIFDVATENIRQGGKRRGANMAVLRIDHPDIEEFIEAKRNLETLTNFNLSIGMTDAFMRAAAKGQNHALIDPFDGKKKRVVSARALLKEIATAAWKTGDPGLIFLDAMNRENPTPHLGPIEATNPCGEVPLLPYEACNLGSINLTKMVQKSGHGWEIDWKKLEETVAVAVRFLDNVIEVGKWPCSQIENQVKGNRKIGLGVMGFAELLVLMKIPYDSMQAVETASSLMRTISDLAWKSSQELALERGVFPNWKKSTLNKKQIKARNATVTSIAPTGTISLIAGTSSGIEPLFGISYTQKNVLDGKTLRVLNPVFKRICREQELISEKELKAVEKSGSLSQASALTLQWRAIFKTATEIPAKAQLEIQAAFQEHTDNAVSKTINLPEDSTVEDVLWIYQSAWEKRLKGITVFRYGCRGEQVLELGQSCSPADCRL